MSILESTTVHSSNEEEIQAAWQKADDAFTPWASLPIEKRLSYIQLLRFTISELREEIADIISSATGKPPIEALGSEVIPVLEALRHIEKEAPGLFNRERVRTPMIFMGKNSSIIRKPRGKIAVISPWNFPFQLSLIPVVEALTAGNCVLLKPSAETPLASLLLEKISGLFPDGVFQVLHGGAETGRLLVEQQPDYIHFTGSVATGKVIQKQAAEHLIPTTLELGGKDAMVVHKDANVERAANAASWGAFMNSGQVCLSVERVIVHEEVQEEFLNSVRRTIAGLRRDGEKEYEIGRMTTKKQWDTVYNQVQEAIDQGAEQIAGKPPERWDDQTLSIEPVVLTGITGEMRIWKEETFGPVFSVRTYSTIDEALELFNDTIYGLSGSIFTADQELAANFTAKVRTGNFMINDVISHAANHYLPYGGAKQSGIGSYHSTAGMRSFSIETSVMSARGSMNSEILWYPYKGKFESLSQIIDYYYGRNRNWKSFLQTFMGLTRRP